ncbi:hypothetical protein [Candidatus Lokiarchaeum ossiferum]|uniref:hypothetical protein n=1 Tax=Candidatus Lokiarchaeum ossiferum TaxID=2951803 RepID=UPI00352F6EC2
MSSDLKIKRFLTHSHRNTRFSTITPNNQTTISFNPAFVKYSRDIYNIHVDIIHDFSKGSYSALFRKGNEFYIPTETPFHTNTLDLLFQNIEIELRSLAFSDFLGILLKYKILKTIQHEAWELFQIS